MVLIHLALHLEGHGLSVSIGLPDRILAPFLGGEMDRERVTIDVAAFMLKIAANSVFGRGSKTQAITVGGRDALGRDRSQVLTWAFLEAADLIRVGDPHVFLRWYGGMDDTLKQKAIQMLVDGVSMPLLIHDRPTAQGFVAAGVDEIDAWDYCVIGCNELGIPGRSAESATATSGTIQYLALLNEVLLNHPDPDAIEDIDTLLALLEPHMRDRVLTMRERGQAHRQRLAREMPMPLTSALMQGCIRRGRDFMVGMRYHLPNSYERGLTNAVNALTAIERVVFRDGEATMAELIEALRRDFEGSEDLRARLRAAPKWGNDDPTADRWAEVLLAMRERVLEEIDARTGTAPHLVCHVVRSLHYFDGWRIGASPDGRRAWTPVADSVGAEMGTADAGPTGVLNSVLKLNPARYYRGGTNLNLTLPGAEWRQPEAQEALTSMVDVFFEQGGQELQLAVFDPETLRDAREHPEQYGDLLVRVAGFNARFVDLAPVEQEELIRRAEDV
jgi:formate C-acetyltransferase